MKCEFTWHAHYSKGDRDTKIPCRNEATRKIEVVIHSNIFAGIKELDNQYKVYNICEEHFDKVQDDGNVRVLSAWHQIPKVIR